MGSTPGKDANGCVEMTTRDFRHFSVLEKVAARFKRINSNFGRSSTMAKILSTSII